MPAPPTITPTGRILRRIFLGLHIGLAVAFCGLLAAGIWSELERFRPAEPPPPAPPNACVEQIKELHAELIAKLAALPSAQPASDLAPSFDRWSRPFRKRLLETRARCVKPEDATAAETRALRKALAKLERFLDLSEIHVAHWSRHVGPAAEEALEALRGVGPEPAR